MVDISGAYIQSGTFHMYIYVHPSREWKKTKRRSIWKLLRLPHAVREAGRQWETVIERWMTKEAGIEKVRGISQLFVKRYIKGSIIIILEKVTDQILLAGDIVTMEKFFQQLTDSKPEYQYSTHQLTLRVQNYTGQRSMYNNGHGKVCTCYQDPQNGTIKKKGLHRKGNNRRILQLSAFGCQNYVGRKWGFLQ